MTSKCLQALTTLDVIVEGIQVGAELVDGLFNFVGSFSEGYPAFPDCLWHRQLIPTNIARPRTALAESPRAVHRRIS